MAENLNPRGPLLVGGLVLAGLWLMNRNAAMARANTAVSARKTQDYHTPTGVAQLLGNAISIFTKGATPSAPAGASATPNIPAVTMASANQGFFGWNVGDKATQAGTLTSPLTGWYMPLPSLVLNAGASSGPAVDSVVDVPVYDPGADFSNNPFAALGL